MAIYKVKFNYVKRWRTRINSDIKDLEEEFSDCKFFPSVSLPNVKAFIYDTLKGSNLSSFSMSKDGKYIKIENEYYKGGTLYRLFSSIIIEEEK